MKPCVVIATYNNDATLGGIIDEVYEYVKDIIVVNDGSTDNTSLILKGKKSKLVEVISYPDNRGKGSALQSGIDTARAKGYTHAVTIDSDGQHYPSDIKGLLEVSRVRPDAIIDRKSVV